MYSKGSDVPRFDLYVVDSHRGARDMGFFIVAAGREFDWSYSTPQGRKQFLEELRDMTGGGFKRMVYVLKNMVHTYGNNDQVKVGARNFLFFSIFLVRKSSPGW